MELQQYLDILRRWGWLLAIFAITTTAGSYWAASRQPRVYEAQARYLVGPAMQNPDVDNNDLQASSQIGQIYAELANSRPIVQSAIDKLQLNLDVAQTANNITANWTESTQVLTIRVHAGEAATAAQLANGIGEVLIERSPAGPSSLQSQRQQAAAAEIERLQTTIATIEDDINQLSTQIQQATEDLAQRKLIVQLDQRRTQLANAQDALNDQYAIVQDSSANQISVMESAGGGWQIAPQVQQSMLIGFVAGLVMGLAAMLLFEYLYDVIYTPQELRRATDLPYLGGVARYERPTVAPTSRITVQAQPDTLAAESYRMLRTNLLLPGNHQSISSLLITSPSRGDGKSEIAANLAVSFAQAGQQVILIDGNLRRPHVSTLFDVDGQAGLSSLLDEVGVLPEPLPVASIPGLSILPAGSPTVNSSEILASRRMGELLQEYESRVDIVIVDSPPLLYSDAFALAPQVDGVLLVVSSGVTGRQNTVSAVESLKLVSANVIGVVLNRVKPGPAYDYYPQHVGNKPNPLFAGRNGARVVGQAVAEHPGQTLQLHTTTARLETERLARDQNQEAADDADGMLSHVLGEYSELFRRFKTPENTGQDDDNGTVR